MTHIVKQSEISTQMWGKPWAAVEVRVEKKKLVVLKIVIANADTTWTQIPDRFELVDEAGEVVRPQKDRPFFISLQTIDPYHLVCQAPQG